MSDSHPALSLNNPHLRFIILHHHDRLATVNEYARAAGIDPSTVLESLSDLLVDDVISLEMHNNELFVHPCPSGRPVPPGQVDLPVNLWEHLRTHSGVERSYALWRLTRALEQGGWRVEADPRLLGGFPLGIYVKGALLPLLPYPPLALLRRFDGPLSTLPDGGSVAVTCDNGTLAETTTAVRAWAVSAGRDLDVLLLEAPRFSATRLGARDNSVTPIYLSRHER